MKYYTCWLTSNQVLSKMYTKIGNVVTNYRQHESKGSFKIELYKNVNTFITIIIII